MKLSAIIIAAVAAEDPCNGRSLMKVTHCLTVAAKSTAVAEYRNQINAASGKAKAKLIRNQDLRLANAEKHVNYLMTKTYRTISRCGRGRRNPSFEFTDDFYNQMKQAASSDSADEMFAIWNLFATEGSTGEGLAKVKCKWYDPVRDAESYEDSTYPCRLRRLFMKMKGLTQYGQYTECQPENFDLDQNNLFWSSSNKSLRKVTQQDKKSAVFEIL